MTTDDFNNDIPEYSTEALNSLNIFHDCDCMIYVEGDDDIVFWDSICKCAGLDGYKVESVGGIEQLVSKFEKVVNDNAQIIIACDADYSLLLHDKPIHSQIIMTKSYSIENIMYCPNSINTLINKLARTRTNYVEIILSWIEHFTTAAQDLLIYDVANIKFKKGIRVMGDSCARFLANQNSTMLSKDKIDNFLNSIKNSFEPEEIKECEELVAGSQIEKYRLIRGHFLTKGVLNLISKQVKRKKISVSCEHLFTETVNGCLVCRDSMCSQLHDLCESMKLAFSNVKVNSLGIL